MESKLKLTNDELESLKELGEKNPLLKKAFDLIEVVQLSVISDTLLALKKTHLNICEELGEKKISIFNESTEGLKTFENYIKWNGTVEDTVKTIRSLENSLSPEEVKEVNKKMKDSQQLFIPKVNGTQITN